MAQPTAYTQTADFSDDEAAGVGGRSTVRTAALDAELAAISLTLSQLCANIGLIQRDDGDIRDGEVKLHTLATEVRALFAAGSVTAQNLRGAWLTATAYVALDVVTQSANTYICTVGHTSGTFATDLAAGKWILLSLGSSIGASAVQFTPTVNIAASNAQSAIEEVDTENRALSAASAASVAALALDLADTANNAKGDALLGVKKTATGAVATTGHEVNERTLDVLDFMTEAQRADYKARTLSLDLTTPLNVATAAAKAAGLKLTAGPGSAKISGTVTVDCDADLKSMTVSVAAGSLSGPAVRVGTTADYTFDADIVLPFIVNSSKSGAGWTGFDAKIGVEIANAYHCRILVPKVVGFGVGVTLGGYSKGCVYNVTRLGILSGNKIQLQLLPKTTDGWCNQNLFLGGRLFFDSSEGVNTSGTRMIQLAAQASATVGPPDSNTFKDITIEDDTPEYYLDVQGSFNRFENCRFETSAVRGAAAVRFYSAVSGETTSNYIVGGYDTRGFSWTFAGSAAPYNARVDSRENNAVEVAGCGWSIGNRAGDTVGFPHYQGFAAGTQPLGKTNAATDWRYRLYADGAAWKAAGDTNARLYTEGASGRLYLGTGNVAATAYFAPGVGAEVQVAAAFYPATDNARTLGLSSNRWSVVYAGTGTINTSDERAKQDISDIPVEWLEAWGDVKWQRFLFRDAAQEKGDGARWHVGLIAQRVRDAFAARGIDAFTIGLLCFDKWDARPEELDKDGNVISEARPAGEAYGIRYEEALAMECAYLRFKTGFQ